MRLGKHPLKDRDVKVVPPNQITVGVLSFIPETAAYHKDSLPILKLCINSIRENADREFDLMVVDNGSCEEVQAYLQDQLEAGLIDILILNGKNVGYINGLIQILRSAPGDLVFHSDSDIFYKPGWMQAQLEIMENYPNVGLVGGIPIRNLSGYRTKSTLAWAKEHSTEANYESGDFLPRDWQIEYYHSLGYFSEPWLSEFLSHPDHRVRFNNVTAYIGASHMQFLTRKNVIRELPLELNISFAMTSPEEILDKVIDEKGYLRLSTSAPYVYHLGNALSEDWAIAEYKKLSNNAISENQNQFDCRKPSSKRKHHWFWRRYSVRKILHTLYEWAYDKYWGYSN